MKSILSQQERLLGSDALAICEGGSTMTTKKFRCIFCGSWASVKKQNRMKVVVCPSCKRETELDTYQDMFDRWVDQIRKEE